MSYHGLIMVLHGFYMDFTWILHGFYMDFTWILHGFYMVLHGITTLSRYELGLPDMREIVVSAARLNGSNAGDLQGPMRNIEGITITNHEEI